MGVNHSSSPSSSPASIGRGGALRESKSGRSTAPAPSGGNANGSSTACGAVSSDPPSSSEGLSPLANFLVCDLASSIYYVILT